MLASHTFSIARTTALTLLLMTLALFSAYPKPLQAETEGLSILIDASRDGGAWWFPQTAPFDPDQPHQGKDLADYLRTLGHTVIELPRPTTITTGLIGPHDIVIRANGFGSYSDSETNAYIEYVNTGGKLLLLSSYLRPGQQDSLGLAFGITFEGISRGENIIESFEDHPITTGVSEVWYGVGSAIAVIPNKANLLGYLSSDTYIDLNNNGLKDPGEPIASPAIGETLYGRGKIVFNGATYMWLRIPQPLLDNTLEWLAAPSCYQLTLERVGQGSPPTADPVSSSGCDQGYYHEGESVTLTEHPADGYYLNFWIGTGSEPSNHLTMPANEHTVTAYYVPMCNELILSHTGAGSDPTASPTHSIGCDSGTYHMGEPITMSAHPANNCHLDHWTGTDSPSSNQLNMSGGAHSVTAHYVEDRVCYTLTRTHTGPGADPAASPVKSAGCDLADQYSVGEFITVQANPSEDWQVANWSGTNNDSSTLVNNTLTMPAQNHTVAVHYEHTFYYLYLPHIGCDGSN